MPIEAKQLAGVMDLDSGPETVAPNHHRVARNITFRGELGNKRGESVPGNREINNPLLPVTGQNITIGRFYDAVKKRIYFFNQNNEGHHGIYLFNTITNTFQRIIQEGVNAAAGTLSFTSANFICNINMIYGDPLQGDMLYWINCQGVPCKVNVDKALAGDYGTFQRDFLDVATAPPTDPPYVVYEDDTTVTVNNLRKRLFKFKTRYVYDDNEKSVTSIQSEVPLPDDPFESSVDTDPTKNARIAIVYQTGGATVKKVEILGAVSLGTVFSGYFLIASIDKSLNELADDDVSVFYFYNDQGYVDIDVTESTQLFDYVPQKAVAQEIPSGTNLFYGNITEGYPNLTNFKPQVPGPESYILFNSTPHYEGTYFTLFSVTQSGQKSFGTGPVHVILKGNGYAPETVTTGNHYYIRFSDAVVEYTAVGGDTITSVLQGLINDAIANGFTVTGTTSTPDNIYFSKTGSVLVISIFTPQAISENIESATDGSLNAYDWWSRYSFGLVYFDSKGRTNGAVYPMSGTFAGQTPEYQDFLTTSNVPFMETLIKHIPPEWALYYSWVRTKNLTKSFLLQWISNTTFKDTTTIPNERQYAYISIENLNVFHAKNPNSPLVYEFKPNDRIRFIKRMNPDSSTANLYTDKDFEIQSQEINPTINGVVQEGQFLKIFLPVTDGTFDFGTIAFANYFIEIYTPAQPVANGLNLYYEFGERYRIGNPGAENRFHTAQLDQQSTGPFGGTAYSVFVKGDYYSKQRTVPIGTEINYSIPATGCGDADAGRITIGAVFVSRTLPDTNLVTGNSPCNNLVGFNLATNTDRQILSVVTGTYNLRIRGTITINFTDNLPNDVYEIYLQKNTGVKIQLVAPFDSSVAGPRTFGFDVTFQMFTGERLFLFGWSVPGLDHLRTFVASTFSIENVAAIQQVMIDPNFSDYYPSSVNSNGRAFVYDENAAQITYKNMYRWSLAFQESANINQTNRFYPLNFDNVTLSYGGIMRFRLMDRTMRIFQERKCGFVGIYQRYISQSDGGSGLITSDDIITKNNIQYYIGDNGIGNQPDSLVSDKFRDYFVDPVRGQIIRLSLDGIEIISELYNAQTFSGNRAPSYLIDWANEQGAVSRITGVLNIRKDLKPEYYSVYQAITDGEGGVLEPGVALVFNETTNGFERFDDIDPDCMVCAENKLFSFRNGELYIHDDFANCARYFGVQSEPAITVLFNKDIGVKKVFDAISYQSNAIWQSPLQGDIATSMINPQTGTRQESKLTDDDYEIQENIRYAALLRDQTSMSDPEEALWEGDFLNGNYLEVNFRQLESNFAWIYFIYLNYQISQRNF